MVELKIKARKHSLNAMKLKANYERGISMCKVIREQKLHFPHMGVHYSKCEIFLFYVKYFTFFRSNDCKNSSALTLLRNEYEKNGTV